MNNHVFDTIKETVNQIIKNTDSKKVELIKKTSSKIAFYSNKI